MIAEGKITVDLAIDGSVQLVSNRATSIANLLIGRTPDDALELMPIIFSLCANAHLAAARAATGREVRNHDMLLVLAENAREHLLRIMICWKQVEDVINMPASPIMALVSDLQNGSDVSEVAADLSSYLHTYVLGSKPEEFLQIKTLKQFNDWLKTSNTAPSRYLKDIYLKKWQGLGATSTDFLPELDKSLLLERFAETDFALQPDWFGLPHETGALARQRKHSLVSEIVQIHGTGLLARMVARLVELAQIPTQMQKDYVHDMQTCGLGVVETARGRLIHAAQIKDDVIVKYHILAPTEWNFHKYGIATQSLAALPLGNKDIRAQQAQMMLEAIDPCVDFELRVA